ncbi:MAG: hypothetical protein ACTIJJ_03820 [Galactobacter sp.]
MTDSMTGAKVSDGEGILRWIARCETLRGDLEMPPRSRPRDVPPGIFEDLPEHQSSAVPHPDRDR